MLPIACLLLLATSGLLAMQAGLSSVWFWIPEVATATCLVLAWRIGSGSEKRSSRAGGNRPTSREVSAVLSGLPRSSRGRLGV
jgi:hypothetical protein